MYELVFIDNFALIIASLLIYRRNRSIGAFFIATAGILILKDLNLQFFSGIIPSEVGNTQSRMLLSSAIICSAQSFLFFTGVAFGLGTYLYGREFVRSVSNAPGPSLLLCIALLALVFIFMASASRIGLSKWFLDPRYGYEEARAGIGPLYALYLSLVAFAALVNMWRNTNNIPSFILFLFLICAFSYLAGNKSILLETFLLSIIFLILFRLNLNLFSVIILFFILVYLYFFIVELILSLLPGFLFIAEGYFDHTKNSLFILKNIPEGVFTFGDYIEGLFIESVPRALWSDKPFFYGDGLLTQKIYKADDGKNFGFLRQIWPLVSGGAIGLILSGFSYFKMFVLGILYAWLREVPCKEDTNISQKIKIIDVLLLSTFIVFTVPNILGIAGFTAVRFLIALFCIFVLIYVGGRNAHFNPRK